MFDAPAGGSGLRPLLAPARGPGPPFSLGSPVGIVEECSCGAARFAWMGNMHKCPVPGRPIEVVWQDYFLPSTLQWVRSGE